MLLNFKTFLIGGVVALAIARAQAPAGFTAGQAVQGKATYARVCASCHGQNLDDGAYAPPLKGAEFFRKYTGKSVDNLFTVMSTKMPPDRPGTLEASSYAQLLAYVLESNGVRAGTQELPSDAKQLASVMIPGSTARPPGEGGMIVYGFSRFADRPPLVSLPNPLEKFTPVTDGMLTNPPAGDWLSWRRTYDDHGFSPLTQINKTNVADLRVAWIWSLPKGSNEATPLVHDGVVFVFSFGDKVQALNAKTGDLLWQYSRQLPDDARPAIKRSIALYGNRVYVATSDVHMIALDAKTGKLVWDQPVGDYKLREGLTGGPLIAKGKVLVGTTGTGVGSIPGGPQIVGLDAETGKIAWRLHTIARPGEPGGESWNGMPLEQRSGASLWTPGSYDPTLGLAFFGTAQTYDTGPLQRPLNRPGVTNDALYTDSTLAVDPDTGKLVWYFQHLPNDQWDLDWVFERQLVKLPVNGRTRTVAVTAGKPGIYEGLDAETGKYVFSIDLGLQNIITAIDPTTGAKTINAKLIPTPDGEVKTVCPHAGGAKSWMPGSYNAATKTVFVPLVEACMDLFPVVGNAQGALSSGFNWGLHVRPGSDGKYGRVEAVNLETRKVVWTTRQRAPQTSGVLATAGGLVFAASMDRYLRAYDDATGKVLWESRLNDVASSCPITYTVNGKQYLAIVVAPGGFQGTSYTPLVPEFPAPPDRGAELWVFELLTKKTVR